MLEGLFDIKNDRRLAQYCYRTGFGMWLAYIVLGAPALSAYRHYRPDMGVLSVVLMVAAFSVSMVFDYRHNRTLYRQKRKWMIISYLVLGVIIYFLEIK